MQQKLRKLDNTVQYSRKEIVSPVCKAKLSLAQCKKLAAHVLENIKNNLKRYSYLLCHLLNFSIHSTSSNSHYAYKKSSVKSNENITQSSSKNKYNLPVIFCHRYPS
jgi:hypothetical protein